MMTMAMTAATTMMVMRMRMLMWYGARRILTATFIKHKWLERTTFFLLSTYFW